MSTKARRWGHMNPEDGIPGGFLENGHDDYATVRGYESFAHFMSAFSKYELSSTLLENLLFSIAYGKDCMSIMAGSDRVQDICIAMTADERSQGAGGCGSDPRQKH